MNDAQRAAIAKAQYDANRLREELSDLRSALAEQQEYTAWVEAELKAAQEERDELRKSHSKMTNILVDMDLQVEKLRELLEEAKINCSIDNHAGGDDYECAFCNKARSALEVTK